jgi:imidazolonepropionase-like amidohydrolase
VSTVVVSGGVVFDGTRWHGARDVVVRDGVVAGHHSPGAGQAAGQVDATIDAEGGWVIPALTDAHCHLLAGHLRNLPLFGVGYAVDMFSTPDMRTRMDEEAATGGARYISAGVGASARGGHPYQLVASGLYPDFPSVAESGGPAAFVRDRVEAGSPLIKVFIDDGRSAGQSLPTLSEATVAALAEEAHARDLPVIAHAPTADLALRALEAGVDGLAHAPIPDGGTDAGELVSAAAETGSFIISTVVATSAALGVPLIGSLARSPLWKRVPVGWQRHLARSGRAVPDQAALERLLTLVAAAHAARVPVYPGTDAAFPGVMPGASLHVELEILQGCGMSAADLAVAATSGLRRRLGLRTGGVHPGSRAEMLVLDRDPRESITATRAIRFVVLGELILRF